MKRFRLRAVVSVGPVLLVCVYAAGAAADATLVSDDRKLVISATGLGCAITEVTFTPSPPFGPFSESQTLPTDRGGSITAAQDSFVGTLSMGGSGMADNTSGTSHLCGQSIFGVTFQLAEPTPYTFTATFTTADNEASGYTRLAGDNGEEFEHLDIFGFGTQNFLEGGTLLAGEYTLVVRAVSGAEGSASFDFNLDLTRSPGVPSLDSSGLLMLVGLLFLTAFWGVRYRKA